MAEPIVIIYGFMFAFAKTAPGLGVGLFLPWAAWVCIWTALMCCVLAVLGTCDGITYFTRFSGELFGALIAILFLQVGIKVRAPLHQPYSSYGLVGSMARCSLQGAQPVRYRSLGSGCFWTSRLVTRWSALQLRSRARELQPLSWLLNTLHAGWE